MKFTELNSVYFSTVCTGNKKSNVFAVKELDSLIGLNTQLCSKKIQTKYFFNRVGDN